MAKCCQHCPGFKKTTVGDVLLDLVPSTGDICLLHNYLLTTDLGLSSCYTKTRCCCAVGKRSDVAGS